MTSDHLCATEMSRYRMYIVDVMPSVDCRKKSKNWHNLRLVCWEGTVEVTFESEDERQREGEREVLNTAVCSPGSI